MQKVSFKSQGQRVDGTLFVPEGKGKQFPAVIFLHGMTSSEKNYLEIGAKVMELGIVGLTVSIRAHGSSEGDFDFLGVSDGLKDAIAAYDFLASKAFVDKDRIGICGGSLGGALAVMTSAQRPVKSLLLRAPGAYTEKMMSGPYKAVMDDEEQIFKKITDPVLTPSIQAITKYSGSLMVIAAQNDQIIPFAIPSLYISEAKLAKKKQLEVIKNSDHQMMDTQPRKQFINLTVEWFNKTL